MGVGRKLSEVTMSVRRSKETQMKRKWKRGKEVIHTKKIVGVMKLFEASKPSWWGIASSGTRRETRGPSTIHLSKFFPEFMSAGPPFFKSRIKDSAAFAFDLFLLLGPTLRRVELRAKLEYVDAVVKVLVS